MSNIDLYETRICDLIEHDRWFALFAPRYDRPGILRADLLTHAGQKNWKKILGVDNIHTRELIAQVSRATKSQIAQAEKIMTLQHIDGIKLLRQIDDVISRATSFINWEQHPEIEARMISEMCDLTITREWRAPSRPTPFTKPLHIKIGKAPDYIIKVTSKNAPDNIHTIKYTQVTTSLYRAYPNLSKQAATSLTILYRVQRSDGGSNWSPVNSYPNLMQDFDSGKIGVLECFCGPLNNQDLINGRRITHGRLALDWKMLRDLTGDRQFLGSWPADVAHQVVKLFDVFDVVRLLVNPPYSEPEIARVVRELDNIFKKYPKGCGKKIWATMTLPDWDDMYVGNGIMTQFKHAKLHNLTRYNGDQVFNMSSRDKTFKVNLKYRGMDVVQI